MYKMLQPGSPTAVRMVRTWSMIIFVLGLAIVCFILPFRQTSAVVGGQGFTPEADTFIDGNEPNKDFGSEARIDVKSSPPVAGLLRFAVSGVSANTPLNAHLRLFVADGSNGIAATVYVFRTSAEWDEERLTWNSQPSFGDQIGASSVAPLVEGQWVEIDLGPVISGDGAYGFAITSDTPDLVSFAARTEANAAELLIGTQPSAPTPTETSATPTTEPSSATTDVAASPTDGTTTPTGEATISPTDGTTTPTDTTPTQSTTPTDATPTVMPTDGQLLSNNRASAVTPTATPTGNPSAPNATVPAQPSENYTIYLPSVRSHDNPR